MKKTSQDSDLERMTSEDFDTGRSKVSAVGEREIEFDLTKT
jgi:hypothetical protein